MPRIGLHHLSLRARLGENVDRAPPAARRSEDRGARGHIVKNTGDGLLAESRTVREQIRDKLPYPFEDKGERNVKNKRGAFSGPRQRKYFPT